MGTLHLEEPLPNDREYIDDNRVPKAADVTLLTNTKRIHIENFIITNGATEGQVEFAANSINIGKQV